MISKEKRRNLILLDSSVLTYAYLKRKSERRQTNIIYKERPIYGEFHHLYRRLRQYPELFRNYTRMTIETFDYIVSVLKNGFTLRTTNFQRPISLEERLIVTLRYLVTGMQFKQLAYSFRISKTAVSTMIVDICKSIWLNLHPIYMPVPTQKTLKKNGEEFGKKWGFPNCVGALDGKHIRIKRPNNSQNMYRNYKGFYSTNMLTVTDANYKFVVVDIGGYGKDSDGGMFAASALSEQLESKTLNLPRPQKLPNSEIEAPFVIIADEGFPLRPYLLRPFPRNQLVEGGEKDVFNYRLARARMVVECSYGSLLSKFNILSFPIATDIHNTIHIVQAMTLLHNIIRDRDGFTDEEISTFINVERDPQTAMATSRKHNSMKKRAKEIRELFSSYLIKNLLPHQQPA
ncbi:uncharacterized protein [Periplaneta americana]|uniref:uncharacterized protein n=1 Tax=Periplaneta americana TaxID=6978 RepID=UPI0037E9C0F6